MNSKKKNARIAGILYLIIAITGGFGIMYAPSIIVSRDATATASNLINSEFIYSLSIISNLISQALTIFLVLTLSRLFKDINLKLTKYMVTFVLVGVPISFLNILNLVAAQMFVGGAEFLEVFETSQLNSLALVFLNLYEFGIAVVGIFWGLWLFPFGMLIIKSKFIPKIIGIFLTIGCFAYLIDSFSSILFPEYKESISAIIMIPLAIGEFSTILWLLIKGVKAEKQ
ncbi:DUF4386 domain-containing protein [Lacinutrix jangbogonensis]|uniref:DUF4386 domain-containing protein n=1 Tax=Lacinutrix jangbogonensis TaxID=1469557 RepID=UPI00053DEC09|nr:DUF4386 domain-containing protein [Lacinutrix jangbogonensis]